jgi:hypothetical protein
MKQAAISLDHQQAPSDRRTFWQAFGMWLLDANKFHLVKLSRVLLLVLVGYAPFAALNDALAPFAFGIPLLDDLEVPLAILAAVKIFFEVRRYQDPSYRPRNRR